MTGQYYHGNVGLLLSDELLLGQYLSAHEYGVQIKQYWSALHIMRIECLLLYRLQLSAVAACII